MEYKKLDLNAAVKLEDVVNLLINYQKIKHKKENPICVSFNGFILYSDKVTMDDAFLKVTGMTKKEFDIYVYGKGVN